MSEYCCEEFKRHLEGDWISKGLNDDYRNHRKNITDKQYFIRQVSDDYGIDDYSNPLKYCPWCSVPLNGWTIQT